MQVVGREFSAHIAQILGLRLARRFAQLKSGLVQRLGPFFQIARATRRNNVLPACDTARRTGHHVVKGQIPPCTAVLAAEFVPQK